MRNPANPELHRQSPRSAHTTIDKVLRSPILSVPHSLLEQPPLLKMSEAFKKKSLNKTSTL